MADTCPGKETVSFSPFLLNPQTCRNSLLCNKQMHACSQANSGVDDMNKYECDVCGYVYDPAEHDGVAFEDLPDDWVCPICGVGKDSFSKQD